MRTDQRRAGVNGSVNGDKLLIAADHGGEDAGLFARLGLTPRKGEALLWACEAAE